jgi:SOS response regulatory protein OraA/RecX
LGVENPLEIEHWDGVMEIEFVDKAYPKTYAIVEDGEVVKRVSLSIVPYAKLSSADSLEELGELEYIGSIKYAVRLLARQGLHTSQLKAKLSTHYVAADVQRKVCEYCIEQGWINDQEWVESKMRGWQRQGKGAREIRFRLQKLGIEEKIELDDRETLFSLVQRKYPQLLQDQCVKKERDKIIRSLLRRGFSFSLISELLHNK